MARVVFRIKGRFASPFARGAIPYSKGRALHGAVAKAVTTSRRKVVRKKERKRRKRRRRIVERAAAPRKLARKTFPSRYRSPFKKFLKPVDTVKRRGRARFFALVEVTFKHYAGSPTYILPIDLGEMSGAAGRALTREDVNEATSFKPWAGQVGEILGVYAMRSKGERQKRAPAALRKGKGKRGSGR